MTLYQRLNGFEKQRKNELKAAKDKDTVEAKFEKEAADIVYELILHAMEINKPLFVFANDNDNTIRISGTKGYIYKDIHIPYNNYHIDMTICTGRFNVIYDSFRGPISTHDRVLRIELCTVQYGGYLMQRKAARRVMDMIYDLIQKNDDLHAWLILQGLNPRELFLMDVPYDEPTEEDIKKSKPKDGIYVVWGN